MESLRGDFSSFRAAALLHANERILPWVGRQCPSEKKALYGTRIANVEGLVPVESRDGSHARQSAR